MFGYNMSTTFNILNLTFLEIMELHVCVCLFVFVHKRIPFAYFSRPNILLALDVKPMPISQGLMVVSETIWKHPIGQSTSLDICCFKRLSCGRNVYGRFVFCLLKLRGVCTYVCHLCLQYVKVWSHVSFWLLSMDCSYWVHILLHVVYSQQNKV